MTKPRQRIDSPGMVTGEGLRVALGFRNERAFQRARKSGRLQLRLYPSPDGKSVYARSDELAAFLRSQHGQKGGIRPMKT